MGWGDLFAKFEDRVRLLSIPISFNKQSSSTVILVFVVQRTAYCGSNKEAVVYMLQVAMLVVLIDHPQRRSDHINMEAGM